MKTKRYTISNRPISIGGGSFAFFASMAGFVAGLCRVMDQWISYDFTARLTSCFALLHDLRDLDHSIRAGRENLILPLMEANETIHRLGRHRATLSA